jgi:outer membrane protein assembly factor BamB
MGYGGNGGANPHVGIPLVGIRRGGWVTALVLLMLMIVLASCGGSSSQPVTVTPLALTPDASGTPGARGATSTPSTSNTDWTTYHHDNSRAGYISTTPDPASLSQAWTAQLDGAVYAEPLVVGGRVIVATEGDSLYALDSASGKVLWHTNVGSPVPLNTLPCGNIDPLGITGTPVYDPATGLVFAVAEITGPAHILVGVDAATGKLRVRRIVDIPAMDPRVHQQRAALALYKNMVYVAYGGLDGDCGDYHGTVVASRTDGNGPLLSYQVPTDREGGIWATSGPAIDSAGNIYVAVGNGAATSGNWDKADSVLRLTSTLSLQDGFAPTQWPQDNAGDADLGSMGPLLLPDGLIFADGKSGQGYLLHADKLGGVGGQAYVTSICSAFGGSATVNTTIIVPCTDGIRAVQIGPGPTLNVSWQAQSQVTGSPIIGGNTVYSLDPGGTLFALDIANGNVRASLNVGATSRFATPTLSGTQIFVGTLNGVTAVSIG